jgi:predicted metal-dependent peptidase
MSRHERELGLGMVDLALKGMKLDEVRVIGADTKIASDQKSVRKSTSVKLSGGGGTRLDTVVNELLSEPANSLPDLLIIVTDGGTAWPDKSRVPFIACITNEEGKGYMPYKPPSWMPVVYVG